MGKKIILFFCFLALNNLEAAAYAQFSSLVTQTPASYKGSLVRMDQADLVVNFDIGPNKEKIIIKEAGYYFVICTGIVGATNEGAKGYVDLWFNVNQKQVPNSTNRIAIPDSSTISVLTSQTILKLSPGDEVSVSFSASSPSLGFIFLQPDNEPAMSSFMLSIFNLR